ncbi:hypothetical protein E2C01_071892 [Portunus trituberculatus]|uniref:Uncharacterized protein n=1 Tax=Portunus trituberculatus TaxID=210409 RepID=A0A5B7I6B9_PORTR|nr:hypothetical protein [Portunus trituberculatus]
MACKQSNGDVQAMEEQHLSQHVRTPGENLTVGRLVSSWAGDASEQDQQCSPDRCLQSPTDAA